METANHWKDLIAYQQLQIAEIQGKVDESILAYHQEQVAVVQGKLQEIVTADPNLAALTQPEMEARVLAMNRSKGWKKVVADGLLGNIQSILDENTHYCYSEVDVDENATDEQKREAKERSDKIKAYLGVFGGLKWQTFVLKVIQKLLIGGSFKNEDGTWDDFEDTAGGCDEITWDAGMEIIEEEALA
jgi:hypothetical protein